MRPTRSVRVGNAVIGDPRDAFVIAEMAWAHDGKRENALRIADGVASSGADVLNIHITDLPSYLVRDYGSGPGRVSAGKETKSVFEYLSEIALDADDWQAVAQRCRSRGVRLSTMCNDRPSLDVADLLHPDLHVIPPACIGDESFVRDVAARGLPVIVSIGGATLGEIARTVDLCERNGADGVIIQYGYQSYPTRPDDLDLRYIPTLRDVFGWPVGYHDHTDAADPLALLLPFVALGAGAAALEKHVTHSRAAHGEDFESALEPEELGRFVATVRSARTAIGEGAWRPLRQAEMEYRGVVRKRAVAASQLPAGSAITSSAVRLKRADGGLEAAELALVIGRRLRRAVNADEPIEWVDIE